MGAAANFVKSNCDMRSLSVTYNIQLVTIGIIMHPYSVYDTLCNDIWLHPCPTPVKMDVITRCVPCHSYTLAQH